MNQMLYPSRPVLIVDDEVNLLNSYELTLGFAGISNLKSTSKSTEVFEILKSADPELMLLDLSMPFVTGEEILEQVVKDYPEMPVVIITGNSEIESAVRCMSLGAFDYLVKPIEESKLLGTVRRGIEIRELRSENSFLKKGILLKKPENPEAFNEILTRNEKMINLFLYMEAIAKTREPILVTGETGVGKELIARALHRLSGRAGRFVSTNVAGLDDQMFTDTLFGHKKGAFTGAEDVRQGLIEKAEGGSLFLDEIGDLSSQSQVKLLRLLQEHEYYPLGIDEAKYTDALVILATNQDLRKMIDQGKFRKDLFYRLNVHHINLPPLRERKDDIPLLTDRFLAEAAKAFGKKKPSVPPELFSLLKAYSFPGNVRELQGMVMDAMSRHSSKMLSLDAFKAHMSSHQDFMESAAKKDKEEGLFAQLTELPGIKRVQEELIEEALKRSSGNQSIAAQMLGLTRQALNKRLKNPRN